jgi:hypothetical protein
MDGYMTIDLKMKMLDVDNLLPGRCQAPPPDRNPVPPARKTARLHTAVVLPSHATLAEAIVKISAGFEDLKKSGLNQKAIVVLLNDSTGIGKRDIERVLLGLHDLAKVYASK